MFNLKWGLIPALLALIISVVLGLIFSVSFFYIVLRGLLFAIVFFGLGLGIRIVINSFFPELLYGDDELQHETGAGAEQSGSRINITLGNTGEYAIPESNRGGEEQEMGNIEDLISGAFRPRSGIDRKTEDDYNEGGTGRQSSGQDEDRDFNVPDSSPSGFESPDFKPMEFQAYETAPAFSPSFGDDSGLGGLPDLDSMAMAFSSFGGEPPAAAAHGDEAESEPVRTPQGNKPQPLQGDFNAEELAKGIRTILSKDNK